MKKLILHSLFLFSLISTNLLAQKESKTDTVKTGIVTVPIPIIEYDSDIGLLYGIILKLYHYGDGNCYPRYDHHLNLQWSRTTKGSGKNILRYDSEKLIPRIRTSAEFSYQTEQALDFYGFNGYEALYDAKITDDNNEDYISRLFYKMDRKMLLSRVDITGDINTKKLKWLTGIEFRNMKMDTVNTNKLNERKSEGNNLPYVNGGLFGNYAYQWNIIPDDQIVGGTNTLLKAGIIYDTRDNEPNPMKGVWTGAQLLWAPSFLGSSGHSYTRLALTHRQYFTLIPKDLNLAYRLSYQAKLKGEMPYYMLPFVFNSPPNFTRDGMGGSNTMRGILRNRVVGEDYFLANIELRWKFIYFKMLNHNFYLALSGFSDGGMVTGKYDIDTSGVPDEYKIFFPDDSEKLHLSGGAGLHIAMNRNLIIAVYYGKVFDTRDGLSGIYIGSDFLF